VYLTGRTSWNIVPQDANLCVPPLATGAAKPFFHLPHSHDVSRSSPLLVGPLYKDANLYGLRDKEAELRWNFSLADALQRARSHPLLAGYKVHVTTNVLPPPKEIEKIIKSAGALRTVLLRNFSSLARASMVTADSQCMNE